MSKLKTLKDLKLKASLIDGYIKYTSKDTSLFCENLINGEELKQEAIKRAKYHISLLSTAKFDHIAYGNPFFEGDQTEEDIHHIGRIAEIVEFYNLKEEDLK